MRENNLIQSDVAQCEAKLRSSRASIHATLDDMWEDAERDGDFAPERHWQLRLAATWAIQQARDVVATVYNAAGATAVFNENPFERRLRDIHAGHSARPGPAGPFPKPSARSSSACRPREGCSDSGRDAAYRTADHSN